MSIKSSYLFNRINLLNLELMHVKISGLKQCYQIKENALLVGVIYSRSNYNFNSFLHKLVFTIDILNRNSITC